MITYLYSEIICEYEIYINLRFAVSNEQLIHLLDLGFSQF
jgi:hypothetical protein